jgi:hypothetical protein
MRNHIFPLAAVLALSMACSAHAAGKPRPAKDTQTQPTKIWTNDDMDLLSRFSLISVVRQEKAQTATPPAAPAKTIFPVYASRLDDPTWYAAQAAALQAELDQREADLQEQQTAIAQAANRITTPGVSLTEKDAGVTPAAGLAILQALVQETQTKLDDLADVARQHSILPGALRG